MKDWVQKNRPIVGYYLVWLFVNIAIYLASDKSYDETWFYPFGKSGYAGVDILQCYGLSELFVYGFGPCILFIGWYFITIPNQDKVNEDKKIEKNS
jgi:hypothetical protein